MPNEQKDSEPENYSVDEMMERLRRREHETDPELVTRSDGSQAIRVRKRKRRSHQPHKEQQRRRQRARVMQIALIVLLVMLLAGGVFALFAYYNSRGFVDDLRGRISAWSGAEVEFTQFRVTPVRSGALAASCRWPDGNPLRELDLRDVSADLRLTSFTGGPWSGEELLVRSGKLRMAAIDPAAPSRAAERPQDGSQFPFRFQRYRCEKLSFLFGQGSRPPVKVRDVETSFYLLPTASQLRVNGGTLSAKGWPDLPLERGLIEYKAGQVDVSSLRLRSGLGDDAFADVEGSIDPRSTETAFLDVRLEQFPFRLLGGEALGRIFSVRLNSDATLSFVPGSFDSYELVAPFTASEAAQGAFFAGLPFLDVLRTEFPEEEIGSRDRPFTTESAGLLRRTAGAVAIERLRLEEKNLLAVRGELRVGEDESLSGDLEVGVAERLTMSHVSPAFRKVFAQPRDGFFWARVRVSGTIHRPQDDFAETVRKILQGSAPAAGGAGDGGGEGSGGRSRDLEGEFNDLIDDASPSGR